MPGQVTCRGVPCKTVSDSKDLIEAACRCMFGLATGEMTLLYFLMYVQSAGGIEIFSKPAEFSGRECRVKVGTDNMHMTMQPFSLLPIFSSFLCVSLYVHVCVCV